MLLANIFMVERDNACYLNTHKVISKIQLNWAFLLYMKKKFCSERKDR